MIYLDNNATTAIDPQVLEAMSETWKLGPLNPSSQHAAGRRARTTLQDACTRIARLLGTDILQAGGSQLLLTSGGTEANNWAVVSLVGAHLPRWISTIEHPSVLAAAETHARQGHPVDWIPVDSRGIVRLDRLGEMLAASLGESPATSGAPASSDRRGPRGLVSVMAANNETGVLQPVAEIAQLCRRWQVVFHTDATQWIGKLPFDFDALGVSAASFTPHKFHGPVGIGGLLVAAGVQPEPWLYGGQQQLGRRPGTEAVPLVVGMRRALEIAAETMPESIQRISGLREQLEQSLVRKLLGCVVHAADAPRLPGTSSISFPGVDRQMLLMRLDLSGVACSTGSACTSGSSEPSHVLRAMGVPADEIDASLRFGLSRFSTTADVTGATTRILSCCGRLSSY